jgi:hypothetical protein
MAGPYYILGTGREGDAMILYHFTSTDAIDSILIHGLLPPEKFVREDNTDIIFKQHVVWLTAEAEPDEGIVGTPDRMEVRITVDLAPNSSRLKSWGQWLKLTKVPPDMLDTVREMQKQNPHIHIDLWYLYFGIISPDRIRAVEVTDGRPITSTLDQLDPSDSTTIALKATLERLSIPIS